MISVFPEGSFPTLASVRVTVINKSTRWRRIWVRQFYIRSGKAHSPVHIEICAGGCNAVDGQKDKQDVELFFSGALIRLSRSACYQSYRHWDDIAITIVFDDHVDMVGDQSPRVASGFGLLENIFQPINKIMSILVVNEYLTAFDAANNNVVQGAGCVNTGLSGHDRKAINLISNSQVYMLRAFSPTMDSGFFFFGDARQRLPLLQLSGIP